MFPAGLLVQVLGDLGPRGQPVVAHVLPRLVVVPPAAGVEGLLHLEEKNGISGFSILGSIISSEPATLLIALCDANVYKAKLRF